jgi:molybdopterin biosynthesis enzyme
MNLTMFDFVWIGLIVAAVVVFLLWAGPVYSVWSARKQGEADLARARSEQQIQVAEAEGRLAAAEANKAAAIVEASAVAEQINRIGETLTKHDLYLRWQWIRMMEVREGETIYVPTEANLPILEATRRG